MNLANRIKAVLIEMAVNDQLPSDLTQLDMDSVMEKAKPDTAPPLKEEIKEYREQLLETSKTIDFALEVMQSHLGEDIAKEKDYYLELAGELAPIETLLTKYS